jgi:type III pantothenate kinase
MDPTAHVDPRTTVGTRPADATARLLREAVPPPLVAVDVGNSRSKLALFERLDEQPLPVPSRTLVVPHDRAALDEIAQWLAPLAVDTVTWPIGSVARDPAAQLVHWLRQRGSSRIVLLASCDLPLAVSLPRPDMVGIDRLLNAVAANRLRAPDRPAIIVDLGTAITVDLISAEGAFMGGTIFPGIGTSARAMHEFTDLLPLVDMQALSAAPPVLGMATVEALTAGLYWGAIGAARELIARLTALAPVAPHVWLTGGAASSVAGPLADIGKLYPHLTLAGIALSVAE